MQLSNPDCTNLENEIDLIARHLDLDGARILELGCGGAKNTRALAGRFNLKEIVATEVDTIQHGKNLAAEPVGNITFVEGGAEKIDYPDASFDAVFMFKSLHHVPVELLNKALAEVLRVLRPGGHAWISEPVFDGPYNDIVRQFHDEQKVRQAAFDAVRRVVADGSLDLEDEIFFLMENHFDDFADFENRMLNATHTEHRLDADLHGKVKRDFESCLGPGGVTFHVPMRVDLLARPGG